MKKFVMAVTLLALAGGSVACSDDGNDVDLPASEPTVSPGSVVDPALTSPDQTGDTTTDTGTPAGDPGTGGGGSATSTGASVAP
ncbi:MAG: hypothetical protein AB7Q42_14705 [Acidimicrobiia bacterium]